MASVALDLELHGYKTGNCRRAAIGLSEAGLPYRVQHVDLREGQQREDAHLALNPDGKVPVLVGRYSNGEPPYILTQSSAILFYADELVPGKLLPHKASAARIAALEAFFFFNNDIIAPSSDAFWLRRNHTEASAFLTNRAVAAIKRSERFISDTGFMGADKFSIADIAGYTIISAMSDDIPWNELPRLAKWRDMIAARPAVLAGMTAFD